MTNITPTRLLALFALIMSHGVIMADLPPADDTLARKPPPLEVNVEEKLATDLSGFSFFDEAGKPVTLKQLADGKRPIILAPVYYNCPHLCTLTLNGLLQAIEANKRHQLGKDYLVVAYSFNPDEKHQLAELKQKNYLRKLAEAMDVNRIPHLRDRAWISFSVSQHTEQLKRYANYSL